MQESSLKSDSGILIVITPEQVLVLLSDSNTQKSQILKIFSTSLATLSAKYNGMLSSVQITVFLSASNGHQFT